MNVAFDGLDVLVATFRASGAGEGKFVVLNENHTVKNAGSGVIPVGIVLNKRGDYAAVQLRGYTKVKYSGATAPTLGWNELVTDSSGGLTLAGSGQTGRSYLVVDMDTEGKTMGLFL